MLWYTNIYKIKKFNLENDLMLVVNRNNNCVHFAINKKPIEIFDSFDKEIFEEVKKIL